MKVLVIKMSSLGDVVHVLPAISDLKRCQPSVQIDWVVEEAYVDIVESHAAVRQVIPIAIRRWRQSWIAHRGEIAAFRKRLQSLEYDVVIDAQGLLKSAMITLLAKGPVHGMDRASLKEPLASFFYTHRYHVDKAQHAVNRQRQLFSSACRYELGALPLDYGLQGFSREVSRKRLLFLHGTTWSSKHWPEERWCELARQAIDHGYEIVLPHGNEIEKQRAQRIVDRCGNSKSARVLPPTSVAGLMIEISHCSGIVGVDTGLGHLATALNIPMIGIYGSTDPILTGPHGPQQQVVVSDHLPCIPCLKRECKFSRRTECGNIHPPCYSNITAELVFSRLLQLMTANEMDDTI